MPNPRRRTRKLPLHSGLVQGGMYVVSTRRPGAPVGAAGGTHELNPEGDQGEYDSPTPLAPVEIVGDAPSSSSSSSTPPASSSSTPPASSSSSVASSSACGQIDECTTSFQYSVTISGVTGGGDCGDASDTYTLSHSGGQWTGNNGIWTVTISWTGSTNRMTILDGGGDGATYELACWDCDGPNVMSHVSDTLCGNWPSTLTVTKV